MSELLPSEESAAYDYGSLACTIVDGERVFVKDIESGEQIVMDLHEARALRQWLIEVLK